MSDFDRNVAADRGGYAGSAVAIDAGLRAHMIRVYNYMASAVALTGVVAYITFTHVGGHQFRRRRSRPYPARQTFLFSGLFMWVLMLAPLALVFFISFRINSLDAGTARCCSSSMRPCSACRLRPSSSSSRASIARVFFISAAAFGALSLYGYTTKRDLSAMGSFMVMGLIGLILASLVNLFLKSSGLDFAISAIGVLVFAGLTAWDTQKIKNMYDASDDSQSAGRKAVMGALSLYLDFINLFLMLLRLVGDRR